MDAEGTPRARRRWTEPGAWRATTEGGDPRLRGGADRDGSRASRPERHDSGEAVTGVLDPDPMAERGVGPGSVPEASDLFDALVPRPRTPSLPAPGRRARSTVRGDDRRPARRRTGWAYAVVLTVLALSVVVGLSSRAQLHRTDTELATARSTLHRTVDRARAAEARLAAVQAQATSAAHLLSTETAQLASVQAQLASTEANVFANGVSINDLDTCLSGVEQALNQISLNDQGDAATTLNGVAAACRAATPSP